MSVADNVHWTQPGLTAKIENDGHGDTCGPIVILDYLHLKQGSPLDNATLDSMRQNLINWGLMDSPGDPGMTVDQLSTALSEHYGVTPVKTVSYNPSLNFSQFRTDLINALLAHQLVIIEVSNGQALPDNQQNVFYHYVMAGGIDSVQGYYCANGDTYTGLNSGQETTAPVWISIGAFQAARPVGYIVLPALEIGNGDMIVIDKDASGYITGAHDSENPSLHVGPGFALAIEQDALTNYSITTPEVPQSITEVQPQYDVQLCVLSHRFLGTWNSANKVTRIIDWAEAAQVVETLRAALAAAHTLENDVKENADVAQLEKDVAQLQTDQGSDN